MKHLLGFLIGLMTLAAIPSACFGQDGTDISQAIPIYFGETINDTVDKNTRPNQVYSIAVAKGQQLAITGTSNVGNWGIYLYDSNTHTIINAGGGIANNYNSQGITVNYTAATAGVYYIAVEVFSNSPAAATYKLQVTAQTIIPVANPVQAGCVTGQVDYISYSLQLIAAGLPDTASVGGTQLCASCTVKPPAYPLLVEKMEKAMGMGVGVSACYDNNGNIFQLKLIHP
jgi:hypothetical protein